MSFQLSQWIRDKVYGPRRPAPDYSTETELRETARELKECLEPYLNTPDPLRALMQDLLQKRRSERKRFQNGH